MSRFLQINLSTVTDTLRSFDVFFKLFSIAKTQICSEVNDCASTRVAVLVEHAQPFGEVVLRVSRTYTISSRVGHSSGVGRVRYSSKVGGMRHSSRVDIFLTCYNL